ncbi:MAG: hypothetical protein M3O31_01170 [Acidobacteriota bacterium]|nr:hypothetical protein [Acidobacteriota bacterium]
MKSLWSQILHFGLLLALAGTSGLGFAQVTQTYKVGDTVQVDPQLNHQWSTGTVQSVTILGGRIYGYRVRIDSGPAGAGSILQLSIAHFRPTTTAAPQNAERPAGAGGPYRVGDIVLADFFGTGHWIKGRISEVNQGGYVVEDASTPGARGAVNQLSAASVRPWSGDANEPRQPAPPPQAANQAPLVHREDFPQRQTQNVGPTGVYKAGDRVLSSINSSIGDYQPCTILGPLSLGVYPVRCDPYKGRDYESYGAFPQFIKPWPGAAAEPRRQACSYAVPPGTVSRTSPPNAQTFQRVIYDMLAVSKKGEWGMTFTKFEIGTPYKNGMNPMGRVEMERDKAPPGAIIYPITSVYEKCLNENETYDQRTVVKVNWVCMINNDGDWDCPTNSTPEIVKIERIPK